MRKLAAITILALGLSAIPAISMAATPSNPSCFGVGASQLAQSAVGAMGDHASSFDSPRLGIGNVAYLFTGTHQPGELGIALGAVC